MIALPDQTIHASCVALKTGPFGWTGLVHAGVLLLGPSASGKSDLALRLIDRGARLIADDRVLLVEKRGTLIAAPPPQLRGLIEVRGLGIVPTRWSKHARIALAVRLVHGAAIERLPDPVASFEHAQSTVPMIEIDPFHASAEAKIETALIASPSLATRCRGTPAIVGAST